MGFTPAQTWAMSLWEWSKAWAGWRKANSAASPEADFPTPEEHMAAVARATLH